MSELREQQIRNAAATVHKWQSEADAQDFWYCPECTSGTSHPKKTGCGVCRDGTRHVFVPAGATLDQVLGAFGAEPTPEREASPTTPRPDTTMGRRDADLDLARQIADRLPDEGDGMALWSVIHLAEAEMERRRSVSGKPIYAPAPCAAPQGRLLPETYSTEELDALVLSWMRRGIEDGELRRLVATAKAGLEAQRLLAEAREWLEKRHD